MALDGLSLSLSLHLPLPLMTLDGVSPRRYRTSGLHPSLRESLLEFGAGYALTAALALAFLALGVLLLHDSGEV